MNRIEQAAQGLRYLEDAILAELVDHSEGIYNSEVARALKVGSDHQGRHNKYFTYSMLDGLLKTGRVTIEKRDNRNYCKLTRTG